MERGQNSPPPPKLGANLARSRQTANLTQSEAGKRVGIDRSAVSKHERGLAAPSPEQLAAYARAFGCTVDQLINGRPSLDLTEQEMLIITRIRALPANNQPAVIRALLDLLNSFGK